MRHVYALCFSVPKPKAVVGNYLIENAPRWSRFSAICVLYKFRIMRPNSTTWPTPAFCQPNNGWNKKGNSIQRNSGNCWRRNSSGKPSEDQHHLMTIGQKPSNQGYAAGMSQSQFNGQTKTFIGFNSFKCLYWFENSKSWNTYIRQSNWDKQFIRPPKPQILLLLPFRQ